MTKKQYKRYAMKALKTFKAKYVPDKKMVTDSYKEGRKCAE